MIYYKYKGLNFGVLVYFFLILLISFADSFGELTFLRHIEIVILPLVIVLGLYSRQYNGNKLLLFLFFSLFYSLLSVYYGTSLIVITLSILGFKYIYFEPFFYNKKEFKYFVVEYVNLIALICIPLSIIQRLISDNHTGDDVVGVFGQGGSGVLTLFLLAISFSRLLTANSKWDFFYSLCLLIPVLINETKIVYIIVIAYLMFVFIIDDKFKKLSKFYIAIFSFVILYLIDYYLDIMYGQGLSSIDQDFIDDYLYKEWEYDVGRVLKYQIYFEYINGLSFIENLFGFGLGSSLIANNSGISGVVADKLSYYRIFEGTKIGFFRLHSDFGFFGIIIIFSYLYLMLKKSLGAIKDFYYYFKVFMIINFIIGVFYTDFLYSYLYMGITMAAISIRFEYENPDC
ncbi:hypothetical protein ACROAE_10000 [Shewanella sp. MF05960]|uniref:hypothetical protein n=1 Tax=Shewanella sp. MF05960 TaxID=3434874 RepID=UPI003D796F40